jgi:NodT family efflux transporter outer membrane factor (OMF) lipoprotein
VKPNIAAGVLAATLLALSSCAVGPNYHRPAFETTASFKEQGEWKPSEPEDALSRGPWWHIFDDPELDRLEQQIDISNQNLKAAVDAYRQSQALVAQARAGFWPTITGSGSRQKEQVSTGITSLPLTGMPGAQLPSTERLYSNSLTASGNWQLDIWGQIRRTVESNVASAQVSAAAVAAARLSAQATLATTYFELRQQDSLQKLLDDTVEDEQRSLEITQNRYSFGVAAKADVVTAQTQLLSSQAQQVNAAIARAQFEHAIAVLVGQQPAAFSLPVQPLRTDVPTVPAGLPSALLERRPDVAEAERKMAAANAQIGVAVAAYFPNLTLSGSAGYQNTGYLRQLIESKNLVWAVGPTLAETLFDGGLRRAQTAQARAAYDASVDNYRQTVLTGLQQVEDNLVMLRVLEKQGVIENDTVLAAREAERLTLNQYKAGTVPYTSVITAQTTTLANEQTALAVLLNRLSASVALIQAIGGGWTTASLPR